MIDGDDLKHTLATIAAIPVVPFAPQGDIDRPAYERVVTRLVDGGITVVTANGNTGEFYALTPEECRVAVEGTMATAKDRALVITGVGHDVRSAIELGRFAERVGARAVMVHQPIHPFRSADGWVAYHVAIAEALPTMGVIPYLRDPNVTPAMVARLAVHRNVVGVKYAVPDPLRFATMVTAVGQDRLAWICGLAEAWAPFFWPGGAIGFTSGLANVDPSPSLALLRCLRDRDDTGAMALWRLVAPFEELRSRLNSANNVSVVKEALAQLGVCGRTVRPPISELPGEERAEVARCLAAMAAPSLTSAVM